MTYYSEMILVTMPVNVNTTAWQRIYTDYNGASVPTAFFDGGVELLHGTPPSGMSSYVPHLAACCDREVAPVQIAVSVDWRSSATLEISVSAQYTGSLDTCCVIRGDIDHGGSGPDISDLVYLVTYMFSGGPDPGCEETPGSDDFPECDIDGSGSGPDISDLVALVNYMFGGCSGCLVPCP